jgi:hypothetical protein
VEPCRDEPGSSKDPDAILPLERLLLAIEVDMILHLYCSLAFSQPSLLAISLILYRGLGARQRRSGANSGALRLVARASRLQLPSWRYHAFRSCSHD